MKLENQYFGLNLEGFPPKDLHGLLVSPFEERLSPFILAKEIDEKFIFNVQFNNHIISYLNKLKKEEPLRLTQKGNLPRKFCREFLDENFPDEKSKKFFKENPLMREEDSYYVNLINILTQLAGFTKKVHGKRSLTKKCHKMLASKSYYQIYRNIFLKFTTKFNWGYFDYYADSSIIQQGFGFSIFLVQKYGSQPKEAKFYSHKFLNAFPATINDFSENPHHTAKDQYESSYYLRTFDRFLFLFGLIDIEVKGEFPSKQRFIKKRDLLDILIKWKF